MDNHRDFFAKASQNITVRMPHKATGVSVALATSFRSEHFMLPTTNGAAFYINKSAAKYDEVMAYVDAKVADIYAFDAAYSVFLHLDTMCKSPEEVAFYWNGLLTVMGQTEYFEGVRKLAARMKANPKVPKEIVTLPESMRADMDKATAAVSRLMFLKGAKQAGIPDVSMRIYVPDTFHSEWYHLGSLRRL
jgi:hypothetical protein